MERREEAKGAVCLSALRIKRREQETTRKWVSRSVCVCNRSRSGRDRDRWRRSSIKPPLRRVTCSCRAKSSGNTIERSICTFTSRQLQRHYWFEKLQLSTAFCFTGKAVSVADYSSIHRLASSHNSPSSFRKTLHAQHKEKRIIQVIKHHANPRRVHQPLRSEQLASAPKTTQNCIKETKGSREKCGCCSVKHG